MHEINATGFNWRSGVYEKKLRWDSGRRWVHSILVSQIPGDGGMEVVRIIVTVYEYCLLAWEQSEYEDFVASYSVVLVCLVESTRGLIVNIQ